MKVEKVTVSLIDVPDPIGQRASININELAESMKFRQLQPIGVEPTIDGFRLLFGERRLAAAKLLGWAEIDAAVIETSADIAEYERLRMRFEENEQRVALLVAEATALYRRIRPIEKALAKKRMLSGEKQPASKVGKSSERAAALTGFSASTLHKFEKIEDAAKAKPEDKRLQELLAEATSNNKVEAAWQKFSALRAAEKGKPMPPELPETAEITIRFVEHRPVLADDPVDNQPMSALRRLIEKGDVTLNVMRRDWLNELRLVTGDLSKTCKVVANAVEWAKPYATKPAVEPVVQATTTAAPVEGQREAKLFETKAAETPVVEAVTTAAPTEEKSLAV